MPGHDGTDGVRHVGSSGEHAADSDRCPRCAHLARTCPSCVQRRHFAWSLVTDRGETIDSVAAKMKLAPDRIRRLVNEESDRRDLATYRCDSIPVQLTHEAIAQALRHDPHLTLSQIARWLDMHQSDFQRLYLDDKNPGGHPNKRVHVTSASRLMIALGRAPNELPGC